MKTPRTRSTRFALAAALVLTMALPAAAKAPSLRPDIAVHTLENGLTIYTLEDHSAPLVTYEVWFKVGSSHEREGVGGRHGITGLSHFFEHMMFRGTEKYPIYFEQVYALGGKLNAWTWLDSTVYWEKVPSRYLKNIIDMEADRLENMEMSALALEPEREVVKSERLLRTENDPDGAMSELLDSTVFQQHPYKWPTVGWMEDLNSITLAEATKYYKQHYAPNNAYVIIVGDFETDKAVSAVKEAYGHLKPVELPKQVRPEEPQQQGERRDFIAKPVDSERFLLSFRVPGAAAEDFMVIEVIDQILNGGKSSRLKSQLVYASDPVVQSLRSSLMPVRDPYNYLWNVTMMPGHANHEAALAIQAEMERLAKEPVGKEELQKAVNRLRAATIGQMLTNQQRADLIGFGVLTGDDPYLFFDRLGKYERVSPEDVQRIAAKYLSANNRTVITAVDPGRLVGVTEALTKAAPSARPELDALLVAATTLAQQKRDLESTREQVDREERAIEKLGQRAKTAKKSYDAAKDKKRLGELAEYMEKSEKGTKVRAARVAEQRAVLEKAEAKLDAELEELRAKTAPLLSANEHPRDTARAAVLATLLAGDTSTWKQPVKAGLETLDTILMAVHEAAWLDRHGQDAKAALVRDEALRRVTELLAARRDTGDEAEEPSADTSALEMTRDWLYDTRAAGPTVAGRNG